MRRRQITAACLAMTLLFGTIGQSGEFVTAYDDFVIEAGEAEGDYEEVADGAGDDFLIEGTFDAMDDNALVESEEDIRSIWAEEDGSGADGWAVEEAVEIAEEEMAGEPDDEETDDEDSEEDEEDGELIGGGDEEDPLTLSESGDYDTKELKEETAGLEGYEEALLAVEAELNAAVEEASVTRPKEKIKFRRDLMTGVNEGSETALYGDLSSFEESGEGLVGAGNFASRFNLMEAGPSGGSYVRQAPDQKENGSCWAYAATAAGETAVSYLRGADASCVNDSETFITLFAHNLRNGEGAVEYKMSGSTVTSELVNPFLAGGNALESAALLVSSLGPAKESALPAMPTTSEEVNSSGQMAASYEWNNSSYHSDHVVTEVECLPEPNNRNNSGIWTGYNTSAYEAIKTAVMEGCPVTVDIYSPGYSSVYVNSAKKSLYVDDNEEGSSHQVVIIGWDDNFSKSNFRGTPAADGAWICRNSWGNYEDVYKQKYEKQARINLNALWPGFAAGGTKGADGRITVFIGEKEVTFEEDLLTDDEKVALLGRWLFSRSAYSFDEDGCFYMSYYDRVYHSPIVFHMGERSSFEGEKLLQYDYLGIANVTSTQHSESSGTEANVFSLSENTDIRRVGVVTGEAASKVKAEIYLLNENAKTPVDGLLVHSKEAVFRWAGYHILDLDQTLTLPGKSKFSVVVTITGPTGHPYTPYEYSGRDPYYPGYVYTTKPNKAGQSYILTGSTWTDLAQYTPQAKRFYLKNVKPGNACIKVFTAKGSSTPIRIPKEEEKKAAIPASVTGSAFSPLLFRWKSSKKTSVTLRWQEADAADGYTIYGAKYGKTMVKIADVARGKGSFKATGLKKNTYYKYYLESYRIYESTKVVTARSPVIYVTTAGGTYTNYKKVSLASKKSVTLNLSDKKTSQIKAAGVRKNKSSKVSLKKKLRYESVDSSVAKVSSKGEITAVSKGKTTIFVYAQNGVYRSVNVTVE